MQKAVLGRLVGPVRLVRHALETSRLGLEELPVEHLYRLFLRAVGNIVCNVVLHKVLATHGVARHRLAFLQQGVRIEGAVLGRPDREGLVAGQQVGISHFRRLVVIEHVRVLEHGEEIVQVVRLFHQLKQRFVGHQIASPFTVMLIPRIGAGGSRKGCGRHRDHLYLIACFHTSTLIIVLANRLISSSFHQCVSSASTPA